MRRAVALLAFALLAGGTGATQAVAQEDGVYFDDPDSPGGKEYSIPHERTRRESGGDGAPGSGRDQSRFGVGVEPGQGGSSGGGDDGSSGVAGDGDSAAGGSGGGDSGSSGGGSGASGGGSGASGGGSGASGGGSGASGGGSGSGGATVGEGSGGSASEGVPYDASSSSSDLAPELTVSAIALGVLLAGGGLGLALRRSRRDPSS